MPAFAHNDLKWRNLLVDGRTVADRLSDRLPEWQFLSRHDARATASSRTLPASTNWRSTTLSRSQRLRFYLAYARHSAPDNGDRQRIGKIVGFFDGRD
jgi:hypothetical protein